MKNRIIDREKSAYTLKAPIEELGKDEEIW